MNKIITIMISIMLVLSVDLSSVRPSEITVGDRLFPELGNAGYDVLHYDLELDWDDENGFVDAIARLEIHALQEMTSFTLDLSGMSIQSVHIDDADAGFLRSGRKLTITPDQPLSTDGSFYTTIAYSGIPQPIENTGASTPRGWNSTPNGVYVVSEPSGAASWFPANDHPTDKATFSYRVTVPNGYVVGANGIQTNVYTKGEKTTYEWVTRHPMATYLATVNIGDFIEVAEEGPDGLPLRSYFPDTSLGLRRSQQEYRLDEIITVLSDLFGAYPFDAYGILLVEEFPNANEMQTLPVFHIDFVDERVMVHEAAHQWFGNHVALTDWSEIWLNEGFARYAEFLWEEAVYGVEYNRLISRRGLLYVRTLPPPQPTPDNLFPATVYDRGAWTLHALRLELGDDVFFRILRTYFNRYGGAHASTEDFIAVAEEISRVDLSTFFRGWLEDSSPPPVPGYG